MILFDSAHAADAGMEAVKIIPEVTAAIILIKVCFLFLISVPP